MTSILDSGVDEKKLTDLKKGQPNVIMFVGLQARPPGPAMAVGNLRVGTMRISLYAFPFIPLASPKQGSLELLVGGRHEHMQLCRPPLGPRFSVGTEGCADLQPFEGFRKPVHGAACSGIEKARKCVPSTASVCLNGRVVARAGRG